jgi:hypothetical protein
MVYDLGKDQLKVIRRQMREHAVIAWDASDEAGDRVFIPIQNPDWWNGVVETDILGVLDGRNRLPFAAENFAAALSAIQEEQKKMGAAYTSMR